MIPNTLYTHRRRGDTVRLISSRPPTKGGNWRTPLWRVETIDGDFGTRKIRHIQEHTLRRDWRPSTEERAMRLLLAVLFGAECPCGHDDYHSCRLCGYDGAGGVMYGEMTWKQWKGESFLKETAAKRRGEDCQRIHREAMEMADEANRLLVQLEPERASERFLAAAGREETAARVSGGEPSRGILYRSAAWLAVNAAKWAVEGGPGAWRLAERLACEGLTGDPAEEVLGELREMLVAVRAGML